jgi:hypothetical protein
MKGTLMKRNFGTVFATLAMLIGLSIPASALEVGWHDLMTIWLGDGVQLNHQQVPQFPSLVVLSPTGMNLNNGWQNEIITFAQHTYDMIKTINVNSSVSLDSLFASGNIDVSFFGNQTFDANDLTFVFTKTRNFGATLYTPQGFSPAFTGEVALFQNVDHLQGEALHTRIVNTFGTHYVRGYESAAFVSMVYTFHYASASIKEQLSVSASGSAWDSASFSGFVNSFFASTNTATSMSYQAYSSDSSLKLPFLKGGSIQNYQQFTNIVGQLENYVNSMSYANSKVTGYLLDPIQSVPGYFSLLGDYLPPRWDPGDTSDFLQVYSALQMWSQRLGVEAGGAMNWLNSQGQNVIQNKALDVANCLTAMNSIASNYFNFGTPLYVPSDVVTYLANVSDIKLPEIYLMDTFQETGVNGVAVNNRCILGRIDCGDSDLTISIPFNSLTELRYGTNNGTLATIFYDPVAFVNTNFTIYRSGTIRDHLQNLVTNAQWASLTNPAINTDRTGYFLVRQPTSQATTWSVAISDSRGTNIDVMAFLDTRSGGCGAPDQFTGTVGVSIASTSPSSGGVIGLARPVTVQVTNQTPVQAYGTTVSFVLGDAFDYGGASGSQGAASFNPANRAVTYTVGPLLAGASADISLNLIPLQTGTAVPGSTPALSLGSGLTNSEPTNTIPFSPVASVQPILGMTPSAGWIQLDWWSDTDRLLVEGSPRLGSGASWSSLTNGIVIDGSHRFLPCQVTNQQDYFRLYVQ